MIILFGLWGLWRWVLCTYLDAFAMLILSLTCSWSGPHSCVPSPLETSKNLRRGLIQCRLSSTGILLSRIKTHHSPAECHRWKMSGKAWGYICNSTHCILREDSWQAESNRQASYFKGRSVLSKKIPDWAIWFGRLSLSPYLALQILQALWL